MPAVTQLAAGFVLMVIWPAHWMLIGPHNGPTSNHLAQGLRPWASVFRHDNVSSYDVAIKAARIRFIRLRLTPTSEYPTREAERK